MQRLGHKHYLLGILTLILVSNAVDRIALGLLLQDIKIDLALTDTQLGFLTGIAFALFYSIMGVPIARWADRGDRVLVISSTALMWSVAAASCGLASTFAQLLFIRMFVAIGEAGCVPPAFSLIADYFSREERPRATAIYGSGAALAAIAGYLSAGWLNELYGWRITFVLLSLPGVMLAGLAWVSLREPRRTRLEQPRLDVASRPLKHVCAALWANRTFRHLLLCQAFLGLFGYGIQQWQPAFFVRSFGLQTEAVGTWLAMTQGLGGLIGCYVGSEWAVRCASRNETLQLRIMAIGVVGSSITATLAYLSSNAYVSFALIGLTAVGIFATNGPLMATIQTLVPEDIRAVTFALVYLIVNLFGMGLGPLAAGTMSDVLRPWVGEESLRYALLLLAPGYLLCAWHAWRASQTVARDFSAGMGNRLCSSTPTA